MDAPGPKNNDSLRSSLSGGANFEGAELEVFGFWPVWGRARAQASPDLVLYKAPGLGRLCILRGKIAPGLSKPCNLQSKSPEALAYHVF